MTENNPALRHRRFDLELPLRVRFGKRAAASAVAEEEDEEETITTAISSESCCFPVARKPAVGAEAKMQVEIPIGVSGRAGSVLCQGSVVKVSDREVQGKVGVECTIETFAILPPKE